jgi:hypothetical protein
MEWMNESASAAPAAVAQTVRHDDLDLLDAYLCDLREHGEDLPRVRDWTWKPRA